MMKKLIYHSVLVCICAAASLKASAQNANTSLSNLVSPTKINVNLLPGKDNQHTLGSDTKGWRNLYLDSAVYLGGIKFLSGVGGNNLALGYDALFSNTTGTLNTACGTFALVSNTTGYYNSAFGVDALLANSGGFYNSAFGQGALEENSTGVYNSAFGMESLLLNTTGAFNTAVGNNALLNNTTGTYNTGVGTYALYNTTQSQYNTAVGYLAGYSYDNGYNNVFLGANVDVNGAGYYNDVAIGQGTLCTGVSQARIGNSATVSIGGYANWTNISDGRVKKNIKQNVPGLAFINKLQPITYNLDLDAADRIVQRPAMKDANGKVIEQSQQELEARQAKEQIVYTGFIAQDVEKAAKSLNYDFSGVDAAKNDKDLYGLRYSDFVVPLVKAVQELSTKNDAKDSIINSLQSDNAALHQQLDALTAKMNQFESTLSQCCASYQGSKSAIESTTSTDFAHLEQNAPNPFLQNTTIQFYIPSSASDAMILVTDLSGKTIQQFNHLATGNGTVTFIAGALTSGTYQYSLMVDGKVVDTKRMVLTR